MEAVLAPRPLIFISLALACLVNAEPLTHSPIVLTHVLVELRIDGEPDPTHLVVLEHPLVEEAIVVQESADAVPLTLLVDVPIVDMVALLNFNEFLV